MADKVTTVYGRKIPLLKIVEAIDTEQEQLGLFRPNKPVLTRHLKFWHDHSDILNRTSFCIMVSCLYDTNTYITYEEYNIKNTNQNLEAHGCSIFSRKTKNVHIWSVQKQ